MKTATCQVTKSTVGSWWTDRTPELPSNNYANGSILSRRLDRLKALEMAYIMGAQRSIQMMRYWWLNQILTYYKANLSIAFSMSSPDIVQQIVLTISATCEQTKWNVAPNEYKERKSRYHLLFIRLNSFDL